MKKALLAVVLVAVSGSASATGLFTKVDTYTLQGVQGLRNSNINSAVPVPFHVNGFATLAECQSAGDALKTQAFPTLNSTISAAVAYANFSCHKVKEVIPVLDVVIPTPAP